MPSIRTEVVDGVGVVTLDAPARRNAFDLDMCDEVVAAVDDLEARPEVGALVVTGAGTAFCAGAELTHLGHAQGEGLLAIYQGFLRFARSPLPTIAAVNGAAVGAGLNLALACNVRLAATSARFDARFLQLGIHPGGGHTWMMRRALGVQGTAAMVLFGEILDGERAEQVGLAWRCVPNDELLATAIDLGARAAAVPRELLLRTKATLRAMDDITTHGEAVQHELNDQVWSVTQPEFAARLAALQRKIAGSEP